MIGPRHPLADITGAVLAGGQSKRMGFDKARVRWQGETLIEIAVRILSVIFLWVIVVGGAAAAHPELTVPIFPDILPGGGAIVGVHAALTHAENQRVFVMACDIPFPNAALIRHLANLAPRAPWVIPQTDEGYYQPLFAVYSQACRPLFAELFAQGHRQIMRLADRLGPHIVAEPELRRFDPELRSFVNLNTPDELDAHLPGAAEECR